MPKNSSQKNRKPRPQVRLEVSKVQRIEIVDLGVMVNGWVRSVLPSEYGWTVEIVSNEPIWAKEPSDA